MGRIKAARISRSAPEPEYQGFSQLNGQHPWQELLPEGCVLYPVRRLMSGRVSYFNFDLAKEMGLLSKQHPNKMNAALEKILIDCFSLRIVNEHDQLQNLTYHPKLMRDQRYMATRYLQLQHPDKRGKTSGDGRSIWNGTVEHRGFTWDVSSRGTGVTCLAPGAVAAGRPLATGNEDFGYGCGLAEIDELYASALMAESFHRQGIQTERILAIIDLGQGVGIGVRAALNLIRPAHFFLFLKQKQLSSLRRAVNFFIDRQFQNGLWNFTSKNPRALDRFLKELTHSFARFAAQLDRHYVFAWLDWDGDNVLADAGIIDYGSVRQFGIRHDEYRYDDVERFSTNLKEQRRKARQIVQVFCQMTNYLKAGKYSPLHRFKRHPMLKQFDLIFNATEREIFLGQLGFDQDQVQRLLKYKRKHVEQCLRYFRRLEWIKTNRRPQAVADGINRPALFNLRTVLRQLPLELQNHKDWERAIWAPQEFLFAMRSKFANLSETKMSPRLLRLILGFQAGYKTLVAALKDEAPPFQILRQLATRSAHLNRHDRLTGNALILIVDELLVAIRKGLSPELIQTTIDALIHSQSNPTDTKEYPPKVKELLERFRGIIESQREDI